MASRNKKWDMTNIPRNEIISYKGIPVGTEVELVENVNAYLNPQSVPKGTRVTLINDRGEFEYKGDYFFAKTFIVPSKKS